MFAAKTTVFLNLRFLEFSFLSFFQDIKIWFLQFWSLISGFAFTAFWVWVAYIMPWLCATELTWQNSRQNIKAVCYHFSRVSMHMISPKTYRRSHLHVHKFKGGIGCGLTVGCRVFSVTTFVSKTLEWMVNGWLIWMCSLIEAKWSLHFLSMSWRITISTFVLAVYSSICSYKKMEYCKGQY